MNDQGQQSGSPVNDASPDEPENVRRLSWDGVSWDGVSWDGVSWDGVSWRGLPHSLVHI